MKNRFLSALVLLLVCAQLLSGVSFAAKAPVAADPTEPEVTARTPADTATPPDVEDKPIEYEYPDDWSRPALIFTVKNGIFAGDENHKLNPGNNITRAEMAAVMVRLLGAKETANLSAFTDLEKGAWYMTELAAAVGAGIFSGVSATSMQPNASITREQAVVALSRAFGIVSENRTAYQNFTDGSQVSPYARDALSAMREMGLANGYEDGSFRPQASITRAEVAQLLYNLFDCIADTPDEIPASGWVLYRGTEKLPETLSLDGTLILGQAVDPQVTAADWNISGALHIRAGREFKADLSGLKAKKLVCAPLSGTVQAQVKEVWLWGGGTKFTGNADKLIVVDATHTATGTYGDVTIRAGALKVIGDLKTASCDLATHLTLSGSADKISAEDKYVTLDGPGRAKLIVLNRGDCSVTLAYDELDDVWLREYQKEHDNALNVVKTQVVPCTVEKKTAMYTTQGGTKIRDLPVGTIIYNEFHPAGSWFYASCADGTKGWVPRWDCYIPDDPPGATDGSYDYSKATKEGFVDLKGYGSKTGYLVWVSRYTQKVIVFTGSKGNWEAIKTFPCSSGANNCPTPTGIYSIYAYDGGWNFDYYYVTTVTLFNGDMAFHSILYRYGGGAYDAELGYPKSHGCIRMNSEDAAYIQDLPIGTTVVVY